MIKRFISVIFSLLLCITVQAQKEAYNWAFGFNAGLTWNQTQRGSLLSVKKLTADRTWTTNYDLYNLYFPKGIRTNIKTYEGCFALSDSETGEMLFYSDGMSVYFPKNGSSVSGLNGHQSSVQSGVILPYPGKVAQGQYIVLSLGLLSGYGSKIYCTVVDTVGGGRLVSPELKNISLEGATGRIGENMNVIPHANKRDYWIVAPSRSSEITENCIFAWKVTKDSIHRYNPVKSYLPEASYANDPITATGGGYFKFSPNGKHFVWAEGSYADGNTNIKNRVTLGEFDNKTGRFTNIKKWTSSTTYGQPYGVEFSPSGKNVFIKAGMYILGFNFERFINSTNIGNYTPDFTSSAVRDETSGSYVYALGALQLGPDGYIYATYYNASASPSNDVSNLNTNNTRRHMLVITDPENLSNINIYKLENILLENTGGHIGITSFSPGWFGLNLDGPTEICMDNNPQTYTIHISGSSDSRIKSVEWNFDGQIKTNTNISTTGTATVSQNHIFTTTGTHTVKIKAYTTANLTGTPFEEQELEVRVYPAAEVLSTSATVGSGTVTLRATVSSGATAEWYASDGTTYLGSSASGSDFVTNLPSGQSVSFKVRAKSPACESAFTTVNISLGLNYLPVNPHLRSRFK